MRNFLVPKDDAERTAIFRHTIIGSLVAREFAHGELRAELSALSKQSFRPPEAGCTRTFSVPTLERWYYACKKDGPEALTPKPRADKGHGRKLEPEMRELLCDIRTENRSASVPLILSTLREEGRLPADPKDPQAPSEQVVRKLFVERGLPRLSLKEAAHEDAQGPRMRLRWQAAHPGALWHGDVCHYVIEECVVGDSVVRKSVRIHAHLDDASRYVVGIEARWTEWEQDMLELFVDCLRVHGLPDALYLDGGATYRGDVLITACQRLNILLLHPKPYDPQARGKMERFWRTLREWLQVHGKGKMTLAEFNKLLRKFLDAYHRNPHAGLLGRTPASVYGAHTRTDDLDEQKLREALTIRQSRRVSEDNIVHVDGVAWELEQGFLAGKRVTIVRVLVTPNEPPAVELEGKRLPLHPVDPLYNGKRKRPARGAPASLKKLPAPETKKKGAAR